MKRLIPFFAQSIFFRKKITIVYSMLWCYCFLSVCFACEPGNSELSVTPPSQLTELDSYFMEAMKERNIPALSFAVIQGDSLILHKHFGSVLLDENKLPGDSTAYQISSATKMMSGTLAMMLAEEGLLSLDDSLGMYFEAIPEKWKSMTVRQTLSHTLGLPNIMNPQTGALIASSAQASLEAAKQLELNNEPGSSWQYNQLGMLLAQQVMEKVTGLSWDSLLAERILKPAGMQHYTYDSAEVATQQATTYLVMNQEKPVPFTRPDQVLYPEALHAAGGLYTSTSDLIRFANSLHTDSFITPAAKEEMWTATQLNDGRSTHYGTSWEIGEMHGHKMVSHSGGMKAVFAHFPEGKLTLIILTNAIGALPQDMIADLSGLFLTVKEGQSAPQLISQ